jgi:hypothetical protein
LLSGHRADAFPIHSFEWKLWGAKMGPESERILLVQMHTLDTDHDGEKKTFSILVTFTP